MALEKEFVTEVEKRDIKQRREVTRDFIDKLTEEEFLDGFYSTAVAASHYKRLYLRYRFLYRAYTFALLGAAIALVVYQVIQSS